MDPVISSKYWCYDDLGFGSSLWKVIVVRYGICLRVSAFFGCVVWIHTYIHIVIVKWFLVWCPVMVHSGIYQQYDLSREPQSDCFFGGGNLGVLHHSPELSPKILNDGFQQCTEHMYCYKGTWGYLFWGIILISSKLHKI